MWEPNRHLQVVTLAQAWHLTAEPCYAAGCRQLLESWFEQCPYPYGPNWTSSLELAIRLVNWSVAWQLLGSDRATLFEGAAGAAFRERWLRSVREHCHFISEDGVIQRQAVLIAIGINWDGHRQVLAIELANRESQSSWRGFLLWLQQWGL